MTQNRKKKSSEFRRLPVAWKAPVFTALSMLLVFAGVIFWFFFKVPAIRIAKVDAAIEEVHHYFNAGDYLLAEGRIATIRSEMERDVTAKHEQELTSIEQEIVTIREGWRGYVKFQLDPESAIALSGSELLYSGSALKLGTHQIVFQAEGYGPETLKADLPEDGANVDFGNVRLERLTGRIEISSNKKEATVQLSQQHSEANLGEEFAAQECSPGDVLSDVPTGTYFAAWKMGELSLYSDEIVIESGKTVSLARELLDQRVTFVSNPPGARLVQTSANDRTLGVLPQPVTLPSGIHEFIAYYNDEWEPIKRTIEIGTDKVDPVQFEWPYAEVEFISDPEGARVYQGDKELGVAPFKKIFRPGIHHLRAELVDLDHVVIEVSVGDDDRGEVKLPFRYGEIQFTGPDGAQLFGGGKKLVDLPYETPIIVRPGPIELTVKVPGLGEKKVSGNVPLGEVLKINASEAFK